MSSHKTDNKQPKIQQTVLTVLSKQYITPHYLSIIFHTEDVMLYKDMPLGEHNKIFIPNDKFTDIVIPSIDFSTHKWVMPDGSIPPKVRTYTHRAIDIEAKTMTIDFAVHEGDSVACNWAMAAQSGDQLGMVMKNHSKAVLPLDKEIYVFVADPTAIPITAVYLSQLPKEARGIVIAEAHSELDHYPFQSKANIELHWTYNNQPQKGSQLGSILQKHEGINQIHHSRFAHIAAEFTTVRTARDYLRETLGWNREECYATSYWRIGRAEGERKQDD